MNIRLITDSTADLNKDIRDRFRVVPLTINFGSEEYIDGVTIDHTRFYEMLIESDIMPTTSQASPDGFIREFKKAVDAGEQVVCITISSNLSGTYQSACIAAAEVSPENIFVIDSRSASIGTGILAELALRLADSGMTAGEVAERISEERNSLHVIAMMDTLEYLKKGGRISKTAAFAGNLLNLKPVLAIEGGIIKALGKARGSKQGNNLLIEEIEKAGGIDFSKPLLLGYTGLSDTLLNKYIKDSAHLWEEHPESIRSTVIGSVIGTHAGPGAVAAAFFCNN